MWLYRDYGSTPVSRSGHPRLACGLDLPDLALRLAFYWHLASAQVQSWLAGRAHQCLPTEPKSLGQGVCRTAQPLRLCQPDSDGARRGTLSLVVDATLAASNWRQCAGGLIRAHVPGLPRKLLPVSNDTYSGGARTDSDNNRTLSVCASSHVCRRSFHVSRNPSAPGFLVWPAADHALPTCAHRAGSARGTHATPGIARL